MCGFEKNSTTINHNAIGHPNTNSGFLRNHWGTRPSELLDLDKGDQQAVEPVSEPEEERKPELEGAAAAKCGPSAIADIAESYMRESRIANGDLPIVERRLPASGSITSNVVAKTDSQIAIRTAFNSFVVLDANGMPPGVQIGERIALRMQLGLPVVEQGSYRGRSALNRPCDSLMLTRRFGLGRRGKVTAASATGCSWLRLPRYNFGGATGIMSVTEHY